MANAPRPVDRYAVVSTQVADCGPADVTFWHDVTSLIGLMTSYANIPWSQTQGFSVWHRRTATSPWKLISSPT